MNIQNTLNYMIYVISTKPERDLVLEFALPYSDGELAETITVPAKFVPQKLEYIMENYNQVLEMKRNKNVKITKFYLR